jgi:hypothetical protein
MGTRLFLWHRFAAEFNCSADRPEGCHMAKPHRYEQRVQRSRLLPKRMLNSKFTAPALSLPLAQGPQRRAHWGGSSERNSDASTQPSDRL